MDPALLPPDLPRDERNWFLPFAICMATLSTSMIIIRISARVHGLAGPLGWDDFFVVAGWAILTVALAYSVVLINTLDYKKHVWNIQPEKLIKGAQTAWLTGILFHCGISCLKISILLFYRRLNTAFSKTATWILRGSIVFMLLFLISYPILSLTQCRPYDAYWLQFKPDYGVDYWCLSKSSSKALGNMFSSLAVITEFYIVTLPAIVLWRYRTRITQNQRLALYALFSVGYLTVIASIVRTVYLGLITDGKHIDTSWLAFNAYVAGTVEGNCGIAGACAFSLRKFFGHIFRGGLFDSYGSNSRSRGAPTGNGQGPAMAQLGSSANNNGARNADPAIVPNQVSRTSRTIDIAIDPKDVPSDVEAQTRFPGHKTPVEATAGESRSQLNSRKKRWSSALSFFADHSNDDGSHGSRGSSPSHGFELPTASSSVADNGAYSIRESKKRRWPASRTHFVDTVTEEDNNSEEQSINRNDSQAQFPEGYVPEGYESSIDKRNPWEK